MKSRNLKTGTFRFGVVILALCITHLLPAQVSLTTFASSYTQDFNTLALSGTSSVVPTGWAFSETGTNANTTYTAGTGSGNTGDTYSFGASASSDRAFGGLLSGSLIPTIGGQFTNNTGGTISSLSVSYKGEQWRIGTLGRLDRLDFQYSLNATSLTTGTWTDVDALDFVAPVTTGTIGALNGNVAPNFTVKNSIITGLNISSGSTFWLRWNDLDASNADDGLSVDSFSLLPCAVIVPGSYGPACVNGANINLNGFPAGGTWTGTGVVGGNQFDPSAGTQTITYTYNSGACMGSATTTITVHDPNTIAGTYGPACTNDPNITLNGTPSGGTWTGIGIVGGNQFDPNAGTQTLTYTYTDGFGCTDADQTTITVNACITPPEMRWVLLNDNGEVHGSCISQSDCDENVICFALQYTPNHTGSMTSYTTGFLLSCVNNGDPVLSHNTCVLALGPDADVSLCDSNPFFAWFHNFSGQPGSAVPVTQGTPLIIHQVCSVIPNSGSVSIAEETLTNLTVSLTTSGGPITEEPSYVTFSYDSSLYCGILPVTYMDFQAVKAGDLISKLNWITAEEFNNDYFEIERSNDKGKTFEYIGRVNAIENPTSFNAYQFFDKEARPGANYYRLRQYDMDGRSHYSPVRTVTFTSRSFDVKAWPNPVAEILNVYVGHASEAGHLVLVDIQGRKIAEAKFDAGDSSHEIAVDNLIPGVYSLLVKSGANTDIQKIVVIK